MNKNLLILGYDFPPSTNVGAQRPLGWFKYLENSSITPYIVAIESEGDRMEDDHIFYVGKKETKTDRLLREHGPDKKKLLRKWSSFRTLVRQYRNRNEDPFDPAYVKADELLRQMDFDAILATGNPFVSFVHASRLSKEHGIPWFADYRDGWSTNYERFTMGPFKRIIMSSVIRRVERETVSTAKGITTVSEPLRQDLSKLFPSLPIKVVPNGYDDEVVSKQSSKESNPNFTIAYPGTIYPYQRLDVFMGGLKAFLTNNEAELELKFYGLDKSTRQQIDRSYPGLKNRLTYIERMPYPDLIDELKKDDVMLVLSNESIDGSCTKVFDYIGLNKPFIVSVNDHGTLEEVARKVGRDAVLCEDQDDVEKAISELYREFHANGRLTANFKGQEQFGRKYSTKLLADFLNPS